MEGLFLIVGLSLISWGIFSQNEIVNEDKVRTGKVITIGDNYGYICKPTQKTIERLRVEKMEE